MSRAHPSLFTQNLLTPNLASGKASSLGLVLYQFCLRPSFFFEKSFINKSFKLYVASKLPLLKDFSFDKKAK